MGSGGDHRGGSCLIFRLTGYRQRVASARWETRTFTCSSIVLATMIGLDVGLRDPHTLQRMAKTNTSEIA